jgi:hypothetical protein
MIINEDYKFRDDLYKENETLPIEMLTGPYKGVILRYTNVAVKEQDNGTATMQFGYDLLEMGDHTETSLRKDTKFTAHAGLILNAMILEMVGDTNATGEDYSEEPVEERTVRS